MSNLNELTPDLEKSAVHDRVEQWITEFGFRLIDEDFEKPWGGYFVIDPTQVSQFAHEFFPNLADELDAQTQQGLLLRPKILVVAPNAKLSWQYHFRRSEEWVVQGQNAVGVVLNDTDELPANHQVFQPGEHISIGLGERHRLMGLDSWGVVTEIWKHSDPTNPSTEEDIVRLADDYHRAT